MGLNWMQLVPRPHPGPDPLLLLRDHQRLLVLVHRHLQARRGHPQHAAADSHAILELRADEQGFHNKTTNSETSYDTSQDNTASV
jgi:hypothetical protein